MLMPIPIDSLILLCLGFFIVATLYSAVGFGGGSSYLALLSLFLVEFMAIRSIALVCNLVVVTGSTYLYFKNGHGSLRKFLPFIATSIPMAFIGASFRLDESVFFAILGITLICSSVALAWQTYSKREDLDRTKAYPSYMSYVLGGAIGLLSGLVGIGGGIFLAPLLNHLRWDKALTIAALSSFFILVNSISGLAGLVVAGTLDLPLPTTLALLLAVLLGGQLGVRLSLGRFGPATIKRVTALLVFIVGVRVLLVNGLHWL